MKRVREKLVMLRSAISELRHVVQEMLFLLTKLTLLIGALSQLLLSYTTSNAECPPQQAEPQGSGRPRCPPSEPLRVDHEDSTNETREDASDAGANSAAPQGSQQAPAVDQSQPEREE